MGPESHRRLERFLQSRAVAAHMNHRILIERGLADVAHVVEDSDYLRSVMTAVKMEREAMLIMGRAQLAVLRVTARMAASADLDALIVTAESVFGP